MREVLQAERFNDKGDDNQSHRTSRYKVVSVQNISKLFERNSKM